MQVPAITNLLFTPGELYHEIGSLYTASQISDNEALADNALRCIQAPANLSNAALQISDYILSAGTFFNWIEEKISTILHPLSQAIAGLGIALVTIELILESINLARAVDFFNDFDDDVENNISKLCSTYDPQDQVKKNALIRRVQPWLATQIEQETPQILCDLGSENLEKKKAASEKAVIIFKHIQEQCQKKWLIHSLGILAAILILAGLIAGLCTCPYLVPLVLIGIGTVLSWSRNALYMGYLDSKGWNFSFENCIPEIIKNQFNVSKKEIEKREPIPLTYKLSMIQRKPKIRFKGI